LIEKMKNFSKKVERKIDKSLKIHKKRKKIHKLVEKSTRRRYFMQIVFRKNKEGVHIRCAALLVLSGIARHRPYALGDREVKKLVANTIKVPRARGMPHRSSRRWRCSCLLIILPRRAVARSIARATWQKV